MPPPLVLVGPLPSESESFPSLHGDELLELGPPSKNLSGIMGTVPLLYDKDPLKICSTLPRVCGSSKRRTRALYKLDVGLHSQTPDQLNTDS
jgi:hypothetical protein